MQEFSQVLDKTLGELNDDYLAKRKGNIAIDIPVVREMPEGTFYQWLKRKNKLGGQHKIPRLSNSREFVEELLDLEKNLQTEI